MQITNYKTLFNPNLMLFGGKVSHLQISCGWPKPQLSYPADEPNTIEKVWLQYSFRYLVINVQRHKCNCMQFNFWHSISTFYIVRNKLTCCQPINKLKFLLISLYYYFWKYFLFFWSWLDVHILKLQMQLKEKPTVWDSLIIL